MLAATPHRPPPASPASAAALHAAIAAEDDAAVTRMLASAGPSLAVAARAGRLPLQLAAAGGHLAAARALVAGGALPIVNGPETPVALAAQGGHLEMIDFLLHEAGAPSTDLRAALRAPGLRIPRGTLRILVERSGRAATPRTLRHAEALYGESFMRELACVEGAEELPGERLRTAVRLGDAPLLARHLDSLARARPHSLDHALRGAIDRGWRHASAPCIATVLQYRPDGLTTTRLMQTIADPEGLWLGRRYEALRASEAERTARHAAERAAARRRARPPLTCDDRLAACWRHLGTLLTAPCSRWAPTPVNLLVDEDALAGETPRRAEEADAARAWWVLDAQLAACAARAAAPRPPAGPPPDP